MWLQEVAKHNKQKSPYELLTSSPVHQEFLVVDKSVITYDYINHVRIFGSQQVS